MGNEIDDQILATAQEQQLTDDANRRAAVTPLPGALSEAFLNDAIQVADGLFVRRVVASDWPILQWLDSPIYKMVLEIQKDESIRESVTYSDEEEWEMCWQFTHTPKQVRELKNKGRDVFRQTAIDEMGDAYSLTTTKKAVEAISQQIIKSFDTKISFGSPDSDDSKKK
jgi:hypothetical protein